MLSESATTTKVADTTAELTPLRHSLSWGRLAALRACPQSI